MAIILSTATGAWNDGTTWVGGIAPGINDIGSIEVGHVVTITSADQALGWKINGGHLVLNNNFTITDAPNCGIIISSDATSSFTSNATASTPRLLVSSSLNPTNPWSVVVYAMAGYDTRTLNFDYIEMRGNVWFLGYGPPGGGSYVGIQFNNPNLGNSGSWLQTVQPLGRGSDPHRTAHRWPRLFADLSAWKSCGSLHYYGLHASGKFRLHHHASSARIEAPHLSVHELLPLSEDPVR